MLTWIVYWVLRSLNQQGMPVQPSDYGLSDYGVLQ